MRFLHFVKKGFHFILLAKKKKHHKIPLNCADEKDVIGLDQTQVNGLGNQKWTPWSNQLDLVEAQRCKGPHMGVVRQGT